MNLENLTRCQVLQSFLADEKRRYENIIAEITRELEALQKKCDHSAIPHNGVHTVGGKCPTCGKVFMSEGLVKLLNAKF